METILLSYTALIALIDSLIYVLKGLFSRLLKILLRVLFWLGLWNSKWTNLCVPSRFLVQHSMPSEEGRGYKSFLCSMQRSMANFVTSQSNSSSWRINLIFLGSNAAQIPSRFLAPPKVVYNNMIESHLPTLFHACSRWWCSNISWRDSWTRANDKR